jgi:hypothetical protein
VRWARTSQRGSRLDPLAHSGWWDGWQQPAEAAGETSART